MNTVGILGAVYLTAMFQRKPSKKISFCVCIFRCRCWARFQHWDFTDGDQAGDASVYAIQNTTFMVARWTEVTMRVFFKRLGFWGPEALELSSFVDMSWMT